MDPYMKMFLSVIDCEPEPDRGQLRSGMYVQSWGAETHENDVHKMNNATTVRAKD